MIGKDDPEFQRPGETPDETVMRARAELHRYLNDESSSGGGSRATTS